jgi:hypothetical protein
MGVSIKHIRTKMGVFYLIPCCTAYFLVDPSVYACLGLTPNPGVFQAVIPIVLSLIINESRTRRVANFGVQQQSCRVNGLKPLQVLESMAYGGSKFKCDCEITCWLTSKIGFHWALKWWLIFRRDKKVIYFKVFIISKLNHNQFNANL